MGLLGLGWVGFNILKSSCGRPFWSGNLIGLILIIKMKRIIRLIDYKIHFLLKENNYAHGLRLTNLITRPHFLLTYISFKKEVVDDG